MTRMMTLEKEYRVEGVAEILVPFDCQVTAESPEHAVKRLRIFFSEYDLSGIEFHIDDPPKEASLVDIIEIEMLGTNQEK